MTPISRSPTRLGGALSVTAATVAVGLAGYYSWAALAVGVSGLVVHGAGLVRGTRIAVSLGAAGLFASALLAGGQGAPVVPVLGSVALSVFAWDVGGSAISLGAQLGRIADTKRLEAVHATASGVVGATTAGVGYGLYRVGTGEQPIVALLLLLVAAVLLVEALD